MFGVCGALPGGVGFVDDGAVEEVAAQGEQEVRAGVGVEGGWGEGGEGVEGYLGGGGEGVGWWSVQVRYPSWLVDVCRESRRVC